MIKYLIVLVWPAGLAAIFGIAFLLARRNPAQAAPGGSRVASEGGRHHTRSGGAGLMDAAFGSAQIAVGGILGAAAVFGLMCLLGVLVVNHGLAIDKPVFTWLSGHQAHFMAAAMNRLTKIGNTWTAWAAAVAAAVCLVVTWRERRWLPPAVLAAAIVIDHYTTLALRHVFHRLGPPTSPLGTFPSGGCDRCILFYGLIAYLLWREFSGRRSTAIMAASVVAALGFNEAYSRVYLGLHWLTDALSGLVYGVLLLAVFIAAIRLVTGPAVTPHGEQHGTEIPLGASAREGSVA